MFFLMQILSFCPGWGPPKFIPNCDVEDKIWGDEKWQHAMDIWAIFSTSPAVPIKQSNPTLFTLGVIIYSSSLGTSHLKNKK